jgi:hypothetical protein
VARQDREPHQQQEQVRKDHRFVLHVQHEAGEADAEFEAGENQLVEDDRGQPAERDLQRLVMENRDADERQRKQDEIDRDTEHVHRWHR